MARHLAEAICELAAPGLQPCFIRVQAYDFEEHIPGHMLLLHVRPRRLAAGIEVAVYHGITLDEEGTTCRMGWEGTLFAVPRTQAGLEQFAADVLRTSPDDNNHMETVKMELPAQPEEAEGVWDSVRLDLLPPALVQASELVDFGQRQLRITTPSQFVHVTSGQTTIQNWGSSYMQEQLDIKRSIQQQKEAKQAATPAGASASAGAIGSGSGSGSGSLAELPQPDSPEVFQAKWMALRQRSMADLKDALAAMLRQAVRFRGRVEFPIAEHPAAPAAAWQGV